MKNTFLLLLLFLMQPAAFSQQVADTSYDPVIIHPTYPQEKGPVIFIDEGHHNFHTKDGRYLPFARLLARDGYRVKAYTGSFEKNKLKTGKILVISNALNRVNTENWYKPTPSAFSSHEIETLKSWVNDGGSLFLIADHMPMAGAATDLARAFGFEFTNGFTFDSLFNGTVFFTLKQGSLAENKITKGRNASETVSAIASFTGQAFHIPTDAAPILKFDKRYINVLPDTAWEFHSATPRHSAAGMCQGAFKEDGKGKIVVFGEAAMFTAQLAGPNRTKAGMNTEAARENYQLLLNIIHWLDDKL